MTIFAGFVGDRFSRKWIITLSLVAWSLMTVCMGFIGGFAGALFFRSIATGVGESFYAPSAFSRRSRFSMQSSWAPATICSPIRRTPAASPR